MEKVELNEALESLINEGVEPATAIIDQWFAAQIEDLKAALDAKAAVLSGADAGEDEVAGDEMSFVAPADGEGALIAPMPIVVGDEDAVEGPMDADDCAPEDMAEPTVEPAPVEVEETDEDSEDCDMAEADVDVSAEDAVEQLQDDIEKLKADFLEMLKAAELDKEEVKSDEEDAEDSADEEGDEEESEDEVDESLVEFEMHTPKSKEGMFAGKSLEELHAELAALKKSGPHKQGSAEATKEHELEFAIRAKQKNKWGDIKEDELSDDDFSALEEAFELKTVTAKTPSKKEGSLAGAEGKVKVNKASPVVSKDVDERIGGKPVKVKAEQHKGFEKEEAPEVKKQDYVETPANAVKPAKKVSKEGDKSAELNKMQKPGNTTSPVAKSKK